jgi:hypothetical protein
MLSLIRRGGFPATLLMVLFAMAAVFLASVVSGKARACDYGGGGVVAPSAAAFYAPQFVPQYASQFAALTYVAPQQRVIVQRQAVYAPAVVSAPVVKSKTVIRQRAPIFRGRRAAVVVGAGAAVAY